MLPLSSLTGGLQGHGGIAEASFVWHALLLLVGMPEKEMMEVTWEIPD